MPWTLFFHTFILIILIGFWSFRHLSTTSLLQPARAWRNETQRRRPYSAKRNSIAGNPGQLAALVSPHVKLWPGLEELEELRQLMHPHDGSGINFYLCVLWRTIQQKLPYWPIFTLSSTSENQAMVQCFTITPIVKTPSNLLTGFVSFDFFLTCHNVNLTCAHLKQTKWLLGWQFEDDNDCWITWSKNTNDTSGTKRVRAQANPRARPVPVS